MRMTSYHRIGPWDAPALCRKEGRITFSIARLVAEYVASRLLSQRAASGLAESAFLLLGERGFGLDERHLLLSLLLAASVDEAVGLNGGGFLPRRLLRLLLLPLLVLLDEEGFADKRPRGRVGARYRQRPEAGEQDWRKHRERVEDERRQGQEPLYWGMCA